ncbi:hypothetical protein FH609_019880 [Streptomyces sp. 3MP-14]|uniref:Uncharacterized protein n=1 Tax=Streptomyces mimosae TaxID=2586635 RepID=A0A5N5ZSM1_9ACTN|nr:MULTISPECIES: hypothetical protein [Streptomyces]KAB8158902.1 hypothetical protein FH607_028820 [Streptomyces mimosae]KAB8174858.1 hypothetical protein FH609_019880 [Streptomyces sp. 3MP-14]
MTNEPGTDRPTPAEPTSAERASAELSSAELSSAETTPFERELAARLREAGSRFEPPVPGVLAEHGLRRGRARLWRRRAATVTGALAVAGIAVFAAQLPGGTGRADDRGGDGTPAAAAVPETEAELIAAFTELLPEDVSVSQAQAVGVDRSGDPGVSARVSTGDVTFVLSVTLARWQTDDGSFAAGCVEAHSAAGMRCEEAQLADGAVRTLLETEQTSEEDGLGKAGVYPSWTVWVESPTRWGREEGMRQLSVTLTAEDPGAYPESAVPPLNEAELIGISEAPVWEGLFDRADALHGAPEEFDDTTGSGPDEITVDVPPADLQALFRELAPEGLDVTDVPSSEPGSASLAVGNGTDVADVDINTYPPGSFGDDGDLGQAPACVSEFLEDSTRVDICPAGASERGIYADVYYPDGASIDIYVVPRAGSMLPLSKEALRAIASAPEWPAMLR